MEKKEFFTPLLPTKAGKLWSLAGDTPLQHWELMARIQRRFQNLAEALVFLAQGLRTNRKSGVWPALVSLTTEKEGAKTKVRAATYVTLRSDTRVKSFLPHSPAVLAGLHTRLCWDLLRFDRTPREVKLSERGAEKLRCELVNASWPQQATSSAFALSRR